MDFKEFQDYVKDNISDFILSGNVEAVRIDTVRKNNGLEAAAMTIKEAGSNASPVIYLDKYYEEYQNGADIEGLLNRMAGEYSIAKKRYLSDMQQATDEFINNLDINRFYIRAVNYEQNKERLADCVYEKYNDLALEVRYLVIGNKSDVASTSVDYRLLSAMEMGYKNIIEKAKENTPELFPVKHGSMFSIMEEMTGTSIPDAEAEPPMVVITNEKGINGATMIAYPEIVGNILSEYGIDDAYILPSSVHEIIAVPKELGDNNLFYLEGMVHEVNSTTVSRADFLSDNVYKYDSRAKTITLANEDRNKDNGRFKDYRDREI